MRRAALAVVILASCAHQESSKGFNPPVINTQAEPQKSSAPPPLAQGTEAPDDTKQVGLATWYGEKFAGKKTANGEIFDPKLMTAAHRKLPFGTWVEVRRVDTGRTVRVRINDRGPWGDARRIIDLSRHAAEELDIVKDGSAKVELHVVRNAD